MYQRLSQNKMVATGLIIFIFILIIIIQISFTPSFREITLSTTTSVENSGLMDYLLDNFHKKSNIRVNVIALGTGAAIRAAEDGNADLVIVHDEKKELEFLESGIGFHRVVFMWNDYLLVGPKEDPANIAEMNNVAAAFLEIASKKSTFVSRGDQSGTHGREVYLWDQTNVTISSNDPGWAGTNSWYIETGNGMSATLDYADNKQAYTLVDRGTWLFRYNDLRNLVPLVEGDSLFYNPYGAILVDPTSTSQNNAQNRFEAATEFVRWLITPQGQNMIGNYSINGDKLFHPSFKENISKMPSSELLFWGISVNTTKS